MVKRHEHDPASLLWVSPPRECPSGGQELMSKKRGGTIAPPLSSNQADGLEFKASLDPDCTQLGQTEVQISVRTGQREVGCQQRILCD